MGRIRVLDDGLVNRIAAGEVVERPASAVKELLENSLDASARRVEIVLEGGGARLLRVSDDGEGMDRDDALLSLERHATSKLSSARDLEKIASLGFRGEALPSIAAVSRFLLRTACRDGEGTEIEVRGGRINAVREVGAARGTSVEVTSLFFNTPARRKFLKSSATELAHVVRLVSRYAIVNPEVRFRLLHEGRTLLDVRSAAEQGERIGQVFGAAFARKLLPLAASANRISVSGFAGRPVDVGARRDGQHLFVNGRFVQDRLLLHAIAEAYGNTVAKDRHPSVFLFLTIDPSAVDVNVHPQKSEVRFAQAREVHDFVRETVTRALSAAGAVPAYSDLRPAGVIPPVAAQRVVLGEAPAGGTIARAVVTREGGVRYEPAAPGSGSPPERLLAPVAAVAETAAEERSDRRATPIAQYLDSYILAEATDGLLLVDQHAAHERVLFERFLAQVEENRVEVQRLLFPLIVELAPHEMILVEEEAREFARLGFMVEPFGGNSLRIEGIPALAAGTEPATLVRELIGEAARTRAVASGAAALRRKLVTSAACQAAIKIHHRLNVASMQGLLDDLFRSENPTTCPHGRPVLFRLTLDEIERTFRRR